MHEHKRLGRGIELAALAEQLRAAGIGLEFFTGELLGSHDPSGIVFTVLTALSGMEREYIRDRTLEGHESARAHPSPPPSSAAAPTWSPSPTCSATPASTPFAFTSTPAALTANEPSISCHMTADQARWRLLHASADPGQ